MEVPFDKRRAPFITAETSPIIAAAFKSCVKFKSAEEALKNRFEGFAPRPDYRPLTKFENRGIKLGYGVWDLIFEKK